VTPRSQAGAGRQRCRAVRCQPGAGASGPGRFCAGRRPLYGCGSAQPPDGPGVQGGKPPHAGRSYPSPARAGTAPQDKPSGGRRGSAVLRASIQIGGYLRSRRGRTRITQCDRCRGNAWSGTAQRPSSPGRQQAGAADLAAVRGPGHPDPAGTAPRAGNRRQTGAGPLAALRTRAGNALAGAAG
jgi:hypothetical protein